MCAKARRNDAEYGQACCARTLSFDFESDLFLGGAGGEIGRDCIFFKRYTTGDLKNRNESIQYSNL